MASLLWAPGRAPSPSAGPPAPQPLRLALLCPQYNKHLFVHIGQSSPSCSDPYLEAVDIHQIYDKFPEKKGGLKELFERGPSNAFFLVKFWVSLWWPLPSCPSSAMTNCPEGKAWPGRPGWQEALMGTLPWSGETAAWGPFSPAPAFLHSEITVCVLAILR